MTDLLRLFNNEEYADSAVHIHGVKLPIHKFVVCIQSMHLNVFFGGESSQVLKFDDRSVTAYWRVFQYLYTGDYSDDLSNEFKGKVALIVHALGVLTLLDDPALLRDPRVCAIAHSFFMGDIDLLCTFKLQRRLQDHWASDSFPDCVQEIYLSTYSSRMRSAVVEVAKVHIHELGKKASFKNLIRNCGGFAVDLFESVIFPVPPAVSSTSVMSTGFSTPTCSSIGFD